MKLVPVASDVPPKAVSNQLIVPAEVDAMSTVELFPHTVAGGVTVTIGIGIIVAVTTALVAVVQFGSKAST